MKRLAILLLLISTGCVCGPNYPAEFRQEVKKNTLRNSAYIRHLKAKKTTRAQDRKMIEANSKAWETLYKLMEATK